MKPSYTDREMRTLKMAAKLWDERDAALRRAKTAEHRLANAEGMLEYAEEKRQELATALGIDHYESWSWLIHCVTVLRSHGENK